MRKLKAVFVACKFGIIIETANVGSFIKANLPLRVDIRFCWRCGFFFTGLFVHGESIRVSQSLDY